LELSRRIRDLGLTGHVRVLGFLPRPQVASLLRDECDVLVLPSQAETFGCVLVEALASGKPVVATRCGGPEDIVTHPGLGALCPPGDVQALAQALLETIRRLPEFRPQEIREEALRRFSYQRLASDLHGLYRQALGQRSA
jgi:glycosyltransferase involved in cell wall biosynthesis